MDGCSAKISSNVSFNDLCGEMFLFLVLSVRPITTLACHRCPIMVLLHLPDVLFAVFCLHRSVAVLTECMRNKALAKFLRERQESLRHSLPLGSYLLKPVQRILKYHLLLHVRLSSASLKHALTHQQLLFSAHRNANTGHTNVFIYTNTNACVRLNNSVSDSAPPPLEKPNV